MISARIPPTIMFLAGDTGIKFFWNINAILKASLKYIRKPFPQIVLGFLAKLYPDKHARSLSAHLLKNCPWNYIPGSKPICLRDRRAWTAREYSQRRLHRGTAWDQKLLFWGERVLDETVQIPDLISSAPRPCMPGILHPSVATSGICGIFVIVQKPPVAQTTVAWISYICLRPPLYVSTPPAVTLLRHQVNEQNPFPYLDVAAGPHHWNKFVTNFLSGRIPCTK